PRRGAFRSEGRARAAATRDGGQGEAEGDGNAADLPGPDRGGGAQPAGERDSNQGNDRARTGGRGGRVDGGGQRGGRQQGGRAGRRHRDGGWQRNACVAQFHTQRGQEVIETEAQGASRPHRARLGGAKAWGQEP